MPTDEAVPVIFRRFDEKPYEVVAIFPACAGTIEPETCAFYVHNGQHGHGAADLRGTTRAILTDPDVVALREELEARGYVLAPCLRFTRVHRRERISQIEATAPTCNA